MEETDLMKALLEGASESKTQEDMPTNMTGVSTQGHPEISLDLGNIVSEINSEWTNLQCHEPLKNTHKFWRVRLDGNTYVIEWGRIGSCGQRRTKEMDSEADASKKVGDLIWSKRKKGYEYV